MLFRFYVYLALMPFFRVNAGALPLIYGETGPGSETGSDLRNHLKYKEKTFCV